MGYFASLLFVFKFFLLRPVSALDLPAPVYRHHRLIMDETGRKLAKSAKDTSLRSLRERGAAAADVRARIGSA